MTRGSPEHLYILKIRAKTRKCRSSPGTGQNSTKRNRILVSKWPQSEWHGLPNQSYSSLAVAFDDWSFHRCDLCDLVNCLCHTDVPWTISEDHFSMFEAVLCIPVFEWEHPVLLPNLLCYLEPLTHMPILCTVSYLIENRPKDKFISTVPLYFDSYSVTDGFSWYTLNMIFSFILWK